MSRPRRDSTGPPLLAPPQTPSAGLDPSHHVFRNGGEVDIRALFGRLGGDEDDRGAFYRYLPDTLKHQSIGDSELSDSPAVHPRNCYTHPLGQLDDDERRYSSVPEALYDQQGHLHASSMCMTPQRHHGGHRSTSSSTRRTKSQPNDTRAYASSEDAARSSGERLADAQPRHQGRHFSELSEDEDCTRFVPADLWASAECGSVGSEDPECPKTAPRAPRKPMSSSCARRKAAASARWGSLSRSEGLTLISMPSLTDDESESLSQPTFERVVALHLPDASVDESHDPQRSIGSQRSPWAALDRSAPPPVLQSAFDDLTLQTSPASKQLCFDDAWMDSPGAPSSGAQAHQVHNHDTHLRMSTLNAVMPTTDAAKQYTRPPLPRNSSGGRGHSSARMRLLDQRRRRGRSEEGDNQPLPQPEAAANANGERVALSELVITNSGGTACVTPPVRYTVSCPLFGNHGDQQGQQFQLPAPAGTLLAMSKPPPLVSKAWTGSSCERPFQRPRLEL